MLYDLLKDRMAVNALKQLSQTKTPLSLEKLSLSVEQLQFLEAQGLIRKDASSALLSLKGKQVVSLLDEMKFLFEGKRNSIKLSFQLTPLEQDILLYISRSGGTLDESALKKSVKGLASKATADEVLGALKDLNLIKQDRKQIILTSLGKRTITDVLLEQFNLQ